ncbi:unnamed protein product [Gordionus sp. m RMFG-2023]
MIPENIRKSLFDKDLVQYLEEKENIQLHKSELKLHGIALNNVKESTNINFSLPEIYKNIDEHIFHIAKQQSDSYKNLCNEFLTSDIPSLPNKWLLKSGWTKYINNNVETVMAPNDKALIFDVEVCLKDPGNLPTMAIALSPNACPLFDNNFSWHSDPTSENMIPMESNQSNNQDHKLIIGHNVGYDRSWIKEQYYLQASNTKFLDTMSLHLACSGLTHLQRISKLAHKNKSEEEKLSSPFATIEGGWERVGSLNNLADIHKLYCGSGSSNDDSNKKKFYVKSDEIKEGKMKNVNKVGNRKAGDEDSMPSPLVHFLSGNLNDVANDFQRCASYCARDCLAVYDVLGILFPAFCSRFPHPATLAGTLCMGTSYLPTQKYAWSRYLKEAENGYKERDKEIREALAGLAQSACALVSDGNKTYEKDPWLWDLDWSVQRLKLNKNKNIRSSKKDGNISVNAGLSPTSNAKLESLRKCLENTPQVKICESENLETYDGNLVDFVNLNKEIDDCKTGTLEKVLATVNYLPKIQPFLPGYPAWYRELCQKSLGFNNEEKSDINGENSWKPGPFLITSLARIAPKLLRLTWNDYPLYFHPKYKWGYLVPGNLTNLKPAIEGENGNKVQFSLQNLPQFRQSSPNTLESELDPLQSNKTRNILWDDVMNSCYEGNLDDTNKNFSKFIEYSKKLEKLHAVQTTINNKNGFNDNGRKSIDDLGLDTGAGCQDVPGCWYYPLPHKNGPAFRVGNPLSKDFIPRLEDGTLKACSGDQAQKVLTNSSVISYWKNARLRIMTQLLVCPPTSSYFPPHFKFHKLTHSEENVTNPDDNIERTYGAILPKLVVCGTVSRRAVEPTWLTASNARSDRLGSELKAMIQAPPSYCFVGADVDSQELWIASILGDSHTSLKMHGCTAFGWMTLQGNKLDNSDMHSRTASLIGISRDEAKILNYARIYGAGHNFATRLLMQFNHKFDKIKAGKKSREMFLATKGRKVETERGKIWEKGSESQMFNKLEEIAVSDHPKTPFLESRICRTLEPKNVNNNFMTSRINWVVQSSAVDFLHIMLVCMDWLFKKYEIEGRYSISIHDEVRYLVLEKDKYRAALALQLTNLFTRAFFSYRLEMYDLPMSVAFFSSIDIDKCLRKEVDTDCITPSNPEGLNINYGIKSGEALNIEQIIAKTNGVMDKPIETDAYLF